MRLTLDILINKNCDMKITSFDFDKQFKTEMLTAVGKHFMSN